MELSGLTDVKDLLLNIANILVPLYVCQSIVNQRANITNIHIKIVAAISAAVSIMLCMTFPESIGHHVYDLRAVPWLISSLFLGQWAAVALTVVMYAYQALLDGSAAYPVLISYIYVLPALYVVIPNFRKQNRRARMVTAVVMASTAAFAVLLTTALFQMADSEPGIFSPQRLSFDVIYLMAHAVLAWIAVTIIEQHNEFRHMQKHVQDIEQSQVMGQLAASIAHEIRNPLTVVRGFLQMLLRDDGIPLEKQKMYVETSIQELHRAEDIIAEYLSLAKPTAQEKTRIDVVERVRHLVDMMAPYAVLRGIDIVELCEPDLYVWGDPKRFDQALMNIAKNGIEAMPKGETLRIYGHREHNRVALVIADAGVGMTPEEIERLGNPYYSTKTSGTGLGLTISYRIIRDMGGQIEVHSEKGFGTRFTIYLPAAATR
ncbi:MAG: HAMP domain-containing histidine kinase [Alicyclobacillus herbarius]|uniref:sensor histidine kinase n=1 Tax=Alicyclobacillus herbarius TaxID=122960 RepID=UPI002354F5CF|nr:HAMP domain-containing sensor histidine kinase [Alicyclobacillus herbarius]MCL6631870.1 HAMP domain-containing histidine kinase [Alicyclobacillus herbarius]